MPHYPRLNTIFITSRLKQQLDTINSYPITTIIAPMGFGKTTAINWWTKHQLKSEPDVMILRQIIATDSITDFWTGFCKVFKSFPKLMEQMKAIGYPKDGETILILAELLSDVLFKSKKPIYFILDDLHTINQISLTPMLLTLSNNMPDCVHIILLSRNKIFNEEKRMRLGSLLCEIEMKDLRLEHPEIVAYAKQCGLDIPSDKLNILTKLSEGWISMIYLNFKSYIQNGRWLSSSFDVFTLINQILLDPLPNRQKEFLILIGIIDEFTEKQAIYLWQYSDASELLDSLSKNNAFITKNENGIYRYHYMLRECTRQKFVEKPKDYQQKSYRRLGQWYLEKKEYFSAYLAFDNAKDYENLLVTLENDKSKSINAEHSREFFSWMKECPENILVSHPKALVIGMITMFSMNNIPEIMRMKNLLLRSLEEDTGLTRQEKNDLLGDAEIAESFLCYNDITAMSAYHRKACSLLSRTSISIDPKDAWTFCAPSVLMMYHREVGKANSESIEMKECMPYYYQISDGHGSGAEHVFNADLFFQRGQLIDADISNRTALSAAKRKNQFSIILCCNFLSMQMAILDGDFDKMNQLMLNSQEYLHKEHQYALLNTLDMCYGFLYALLGHPESAPKWFAEGRLSEALVMFPATPMLHTFYNQLLIAQGEWTQVLARKEECEELYNVHHNVLCKIWLHIQLAIALERVGKQEESKKELIAALDNAIPDQIIMPFAESEYYITYMLQELHITGIYIREIENIRILAKQFRNSRQKICWEHFGEYENYGLSKREFEIAKLAAKRKTNAEIAEELHLAEGTVRNQLSRIFNKLDISGDVKNKRFELEALFKMQN